MAVSLTQLSQDHTNRSRASSGAANMPYFPETTAYMPVPEFFQHPGFPTPPRHYGTYGYQPEYSYGAQDLHPHLQYATATYQNFHVPPPPPPAAYKPMRYSPELDQPPPVPPKNDANYLGTQSTTARPHPNSLLPQTSSQARLASNTQLSEDISQGRLLSGSQSSTVSSNIEPDTLPPHSNPQALTKTQSAAFEDSCPIPPVRLGKDEVWDSQSGFAMFLITREAAHMPAFLSTKPRLKVTRLSTNAPMGHIRFHTMLSSDIELSINGRQTAISHSLIHNRWSFRSATSQNEGVEKWYWVKDKKTGGAKLEESKKRGKVLARMKGDLLTFEDARLSEANYDELLLSAVAMAEAARRSNKGHVTDLANTIGDLASHGSSLGGDGGGGGS